MVALKIATKYTKKKIKKIQPMRVHENKMVLTYLNSCSHLDYHIIIDNISMEYDLAIIVCPLFWADTKYLFFTVLKSELIEQIKI